MSKTTRCKFKCESVTKRNGHSGHEFVYDAEFIVVYGDSPENTKFFAATPSGKLNVAQGVEDRFVAGKEYYIDITEVEEPASK